MAIRLLSKGVHFEDRVGMYAKFVEQLAERTGAVGIADAAYALGVTFARLLDDERRYADPYEWRKLIGEAAAIVGAPAELVDESARKSGLVSALGVTQTIVPLHDSFADYLAGVAHAQSIVSLPDRLRSGDEQRILFAAEAAGVNDLMAALVVRDLPLLSVKLGRRDRRTVRDESLDEVLALVRNLVALEAVTGIQLWRAGDRVGAFSDFSKKASWLDDDSRRALSTTTSSVICDGGPLDIAVSIWRQHLRRVLAGANTLPSDRPTSAEDAVQALVLHITSRADHVRKLLAVLPPGARGRVTEELGELGLTAIVAPTRRSAFGTEKWDMTYWRTKEVNVAVGTPPEQSGNDRYQWGRGTVDHVLSRSAEADAGELVRGAINKLVGRNWL